jgi:membrane associated rhomboid family serine protease
VIWLLVGGGCLIVAAIYAVYWLRPKPGIVRPVWRNVVLRWGHSAVWVLLAISFFLRAADGESLASQANVLALVSGALYAVFVAVAVIDRRR